MISLQLNLPNLRDLGCRLLHDELACLAQSALRLFGVYVRHIHLVDSLLTVVERLLIYITSTSEHF